MMGLDNVSMASVNSSISQLSEHETEELTERYTELKHIMESFSNERDRGDDEDDDDGTIVIHDNQSPRSITEQSSRSTSRRLYRRIQHGQEVETNCNPGIPTMSPAISETEELEEIPPSKLKNGRALSNDILNFFAM